MENIMWILNRDVFKHFNDITYELFFVLCVRREGEQKRVKKPQKFRPENWMNFVYLALYRIIDRKDEKSSFYEMSLCDWIVTQTAAAHIFMLHNNSFSVVPWLEKSNFASYLCGYTIEGKKSATKRNSFVHYFFADASFPSILPDAAEEDLNCIQCLLFIIDVINVVAATTQNRNLAACT